MPRGDRARLARDPAYDGRFFTAVRTTRIYCRPVCPVKPARSENVIFFPTAAAAERAGYRPCLRCRPETAPGSPACTRFRRRNSRNSGIGSPRSTPRRGIVSSRPMPSWGN